MQLLMLELHNSISASDSGLVAGELLLMLILDGMLLLHANLVMLVPTVRVGVVLMGQHGVGVGRRPRPGLIRAGPTANLVRAGNDSVGARREALLRLSLILALHEAAEAAAVGHAISVCRAAVRVDRAT